MKQIAWTAAAVVMFGVLGTMALAYNGAFNVAADDPHWDVTTRTLAWVRERAIAARSADVPAPNLADPDLIAIGADHYAAMCVDCHLAPGIGDNELRQGLYPKPPNLTERRDRRPEESFWIIKHGIKMSAMPAWGVTHDDEAIWGLVAFLQQLPTLDAAGYHALTNAGEDAETDTMPEGREHGDHQHGEGTPDPAHAGPTANGHVGADEVAHEHGGREGST
jgi:mono/diheme cytochrome c family protein